MVCNTRARRPGPKPHELACEPEVRTFGAAHRVRRDAAGDPPGGRADRAIGTGDPSGGAGLVAGRGGHGADGDARHRSGCGHHIPGGDRRSVALCDAARADGLSRPGAVGGLERGHDQARRHHQDRQPPGPPHAGGVRLELSASAARRPGQAGEGRCRAEKGSRDRLEGSVPPQSALSGAAQEG